jgi:hypothetical protein
MDEFSFPEILKPYFSPAMVEKITRKHEDRVKQIVLEYTLKLAAEVIREEQGSCVK